MRAREPIGGQEIAKRTCSLVFPGMIGLGGGGGLSPFTQSRGFLLYTWQWKQHVGPTWEPGRRLQQHSFRQLRSHGPERPLINRSRPKQLWGFALGRPEKSTSPNSHPLHPLHLAASPIVTLDGKHPHSNSGAKASSSASLKIITALSVSAAARQAALPDAPGAC